MRKGQSALEVALLIVVAVLVYTAMNGYLQRSVNAQLHNVQEQLNHPGGGFTPGG
jgi:hypothetical protein